MERKSLIKKMMMGKVSIPDFCLPIEQRFSGKTIRSKSKDIETVLVKGDHFYLYCSFFEKVFL